MLAAVIIGGALGALCRFTLGLVWQAPGGTLTVNVVGCFLIGVLAPTIHSRARWLSGLVITGFLGGFTTYSAFAQDAFLLLESSDPNGPWLALGYVLATASAATLAVSAGVLLNSRLGRAS